MRCCLIRISRRLGRRLLVTSMFVREVRLTASARAAIGMFTRMIYLAIGTKPLLVLAVGFALVLALLPSIATMRGVP